MNQQRIGTLTRRKNIIKFFFLSIKIIINIILFDSYNFIFVTVLQPTARWYPEVSTPNQVQSAPCKQPSRALRSRSWIFSFGFACFQLFSNPRAI